MSIRDAAIQVLKESDKPLHTDELTKKIIEKGLWESHGKTPARTVGARLYLDIKKHRDLSPFVKVAPHTFSLRDNQPTTAADVGSPMPKMERAANNSNEDHSFLASAKRVLDKFGNRKSMHYKDITDKALKQGWLKTDGKTPAATMNARLVTKIKQAKISEKPGQFIRTSSGYYSLAEWIGIGLLEQISKHNREVKKKLLSELMKLTPSQFEELVAQLLTEMGFEKIEITSSHNDGGIDVRGILLIGDVVRIKMVVQAKRWKKNIQRPTVQQVRGSLSTHEQGLIITTSNFSSGAKEEANQPDRVPVALMNNEQLVTLLMEYDIGVHRSSHDLFELGKL